MVDNEKRKKLAVEFERQHTLTMDQRKQLILNKLNRAIEQSQQLRRREDSLQSQ